MTSKTLDWYVSVKDKIIMVNLIGNCTNETSARLRELLEEIILIDNAYGLIIYCRDFDGVTKDAYGDFSAFLNHSRELFPNSFSLSSLHPLIKEILIQDNIIFTNELNNNLKDALGGFVLPNKIKYCKIPVKVFLTFQTEVVFSIFIKLSENKFVKLNHEKDNIRDTVIRYHEEKELTDIFAVETDYLNFLNVIKNKNSDLLFDPATKVDEKVLILENTYKMLKGSLNSVGMNEITFEVCKKLVDSTVGVLSENPNIFRIIKKFSANCPAEFKRAITSMFVSNVILSSFNWSNPQLKQKMNLAALMEDMLLNEGESEKIRMISQSENIDGEGKRFITNHVKTILKTLEAHKTIPLEVLQIVEQHHEKPDGKGFPYGIKESGFSQLSAFSFVANVFVDEVFKTNFDASKKDEILLKMKQDYTGANFSKAVESLMVCFGCIDLAS